MMTPCLFGSWSLRHTRRAGRGSTLESTTSHEIVVRHAVRYRHQPSPRGISRFCRFGRIMYNNNQSTTDNPKKAYEGKSAMTPNRTTHKRTKIPIAVRFAANHLGVSARLHITPDEFARAISGNDCSADAKYAVQAFLNEADPAEIAELVTCGVTSFSLLSKIAKRTLSPLHPNRVYLEQFTS